MCIRDRVSALAGQLRFPDVRQAQAHHADLSRQREAMEQALLQAEQDNRQQQTRLTQLEAALRQLTELLRQGSDADRKTLEERNQALTQQRQEKLERQQQIRTRKMCIRDRYDIAFCVRSIREDIGEEQYVELFFDLLGIKPDWEKIGRAHV